MRRRAGCARSRSSISRDPTRRKTIYADSGTMGLTPDQRDLVLNLYDGYMQQVPQLNMGELQRLYFHSDLVRVRNVGNKFEETSKDTYKSEREMSVCEMDSMYQKARARGGDRARRGRRGACSPAVHLAATGERGATVPVAAAAEPPHRRRALLPPGEAASRRRSSRRRRPSPTPAVAPQATPQAAPKPAPPPGAAAASCRPARGPPSAAERGRRSDRIAVVRHARAARAVRRGRRPGGRDPPRSRAARTSARRSRGSRSPRRA